MMYYNASKTAVTKLNPKLSADIGAQETVCQMTFKSWRFSFSILVTNMLPKTNISKPASELSNVAVIQISVLFWLQAI
jgi:hypothetical protein